MIVGLDQYLAADAGYVAIGAIDGAELDDRGYRIGKSTVRNSAEPSSMVINFCSEARPKVRSPTTSPRLFATTADASHSTRQALLGLAAALAKIENHFVNALLFGFEQAIADVIGAAWIERGQAKSEYIRIGFLRDDFRGSQFFPNNFD